MHSLQLGPGYRKKAQNFYSIFLLRSHLSTPSPKCASTILAFCAFLSLHPCRPEPPWLPQPPNAGRCLLGQHLPPCPSPALRTPGASSTLQGSLNPKMAPDLASSSGSGPGWTHAGCTSGCPPSDKAQACPCSAPALRAIQGTQPPVKLGFDPESPHSAPILSYLPPFPQASYFPQHLVCLGLTQHFLGTHWGWPDCPQTPSLWSSCRSITVFPFAPCTTTQDKAVRTPSSPFSASRACLKAAAPGFCHIPLSHTHAARLRPSARAHTHSRRSPRDRAAGSPRPPALQACISAGHPP